MFKHGKMSAIEYITGEFSTRGGVGRSHSQKMESLECYRFTALRHAGGPIYAVGKGASLVSVRAFRWTGAEHAQNQACAAARPGHDIAAHVALRSSPEKPTRCDRGAPWQCAPRDSHAVLSPPPRTRFRQVVCLVYHYDCAVSGPDAPLALALLGPRFAVCILFAAA